MSWKRQNGAWVCGLYVIKQRFRYFKLFFGGKFVGNFNTLQDAKDSISD